jgi:hypothetical protein
MLEDGLDVPRAADAARLSDLLARVAPGARLERRFSRPSVEIDRTRRDAEMARGIALPDLNRYAQLIDAAPAGERERLLEVVRALVDDPAIESAFLEPLAVPAALGFDAFSGLFEPPASGAQPPAVAGPGLITPDFSDQQGYLGTPPDGIGALDVAAVAGADGSGIQMVDVEGAWLWSHEDLPSPLIEIGTPIESLSWRNHGTAVLGEIRGTDNGLGVRGIAPACAVGGSSIGSQSVADAIDQAAAALDPGDVILIELHAPGPNATGAGQFGYVCMEFWQDNFDAIQLASATGIVVCEAAGNGQQDLDDPVYMGLFDRDVRDSGAIVCGASSGASLTPAWFTNYGSRVDLHGWGLDVTTCAYGDLQGDPLPEEEWYTGGFSGTSSASPIVVGAVISLQGMVQDAFGLPLDARLARDLLVTTGTPQQGTEQIGPRPSLADAWDLAASGIGEVAGTVTDLASGLAVEGVRVEVEETGAFARTAADGSFRLTLLAGSYALRLSSFFYETMTVPVTVEHVTTTPADVALAPLPVADLVVHAVDAGQSPLAGVRVTPLDVPLTGGVSAGDGRVVIAGVPFDVAVPYRADRLPGYGATHRVATIAGGSVPPGGTLHLIEPLPDAVEDFEAGPGGFAADALWSWGTPQAGGPTGGFSGVACWGVGMTDDYPDDATGHLESPVYDLSGAPVVFLSFHQWRETEAGFDGVQLEAWEAGGWQVREPLGGYTDLVLGGLGYEPGWSGVSDGWEGAVFDLTDLAGPDLRVRLVFGSDGGVNGPGFWIDEIALDTGGAAAAIASPQSDAPAARGVGLAVFPNPLNPSATIAWRLARPGALRVDLYDVGGRHLRTLFDGQVGETAGTLDWDGRDARGRAVASGVYLVRLRDGAGAVTSRRVVVAR